MWKSLKAERNLEDPTSYVARKMDERISKERELWMAIPTVTDLKCAWQLLVQSANPRATMRTMRPSQSAAYCRARDAGIWRTAVKLLGDTPIDREAEARQFSTLPMWMAGLGLRFAERLATSGFLGPPGQTHSR